MKTRKPPIRQVETDSVRFHRIGPIEFWMTQLNHIFLLVNGEPTFPSLQGGQIVRYDLPGFKAPPAVEAKLVELLRKQRDIRAGWTTFEEDETAFTYS